MTFSTSQPESNDLRTSPPQRHVSPTARPCARRTGDLWLFAVIGVLVAGCAVATPFTQRAHISKQITERAGHGVRGDTAATVALPPGVSIADGISEDQAVAVALWNNAAFQQTLSQLQLARADLAQAGMLTNPNLSVLFPLGPKQLEFAAMIPLEALWMRPIRARIATLDAERIASALVQSGLDLVRDVRWALSDLALARDRAAIAKKTQTLRRRIAEISEGLASAGDATGVSVLSAQAEAAAADAALVRVQADVVVADQRLLLLLGLCETAPDAQFILAPTRRWPLANRSDLERLALAARPDLRAAELSLEAAAERAGLATAEIFTLSAIVDANGQGNKGFEMGPGLLVGLPIFNQNQTGRLRAEAELERAAWNYLAARQRIVSEVRQADASVRQAAAALRTQSEDAVPKFEEVVSKSERMYAMGELAALDLQLNTQQLVAAQLRQAELAGDLRRARADLDRSLGADPTRWKEPVKP